MTKVLALPKIYVVFGLFFGILCSSCAQIYNKKLIITGWDEPTPARFLSGYKTFNSLPFDGTAVVVTAEGDPASIGKSPFAKAFSGDHWNETWFDASEKDLNLVTADSSRKLKDNFLVLNANPGNVDWFDNAGWAQIIDHWRLAAKIAADCGLKGIIFDPEAYSAGYSQFEGSLQADRAHHSTAEYQNEARMRGQEVIDAVKAEDPSITILCYYAYQGVNWTESPDGSVHVLAGQPYQLLPAFLNGWLDHASPQMTFVDGDEPAYHYNSRIEFLNGANQMRNKNLALVPKEDWATYRAQFQAGFGIYLDAYLKSVGQAYYMNPHGASKAERLYINLKSATDAADQYIWVYGEGGRWWPKASGLVPHSWSEVFPGIRTSFNALTKPSTFVTSLAQESGFQNLLLNGDFASGLAHWSNWQSAQSHGSFEFSSGAEEKSVSNGCFFQAVRVSKGSVYAVSAVAQSQGTAKPTLVIRWKDSSGNWVLEGDDRILSGRADSGGSTLISGLVKVPMGAAYLVVLLNGTSSGSASDSIVFKNAKVIGNVIH